MYRHILVPVDLTEKNATAIDAARDLATGDTEVTVLHVIEMLDAPFEELEDFYGKLEETARSRMEQLAAPLVEAGLSVAQRVCYGKRVPEILGYAREHDADLVIIGSHRVDPEHPGRNWLTISYQVAILADGPVLMVK